MNVLSTVGAFLMSVFKSFSEILFLQSKIAGAILVIMTFFSPKTGLSGILAVLAVWIFSYLIRFHDRMLKETCYIYNPLLVGMSIGFLFDTSLKFLCLVSIAGIFTFFITFLTVNILAKASLPALSLPFSLVGIVLYLAAIKYLSTSPATAPGSPLASALQLISSLNPAVTGQPETLPPQYFRPHPPAFRPPRPIGGPPGFPPPHLNFPPPEIPVAPADSGTISDNGSAPNSTARNIPAPNQLGPRAEPQHPILQPGFVTYIPSYIRSYFAALGALFFIPYTLAGIIIALLLLIHSRILFFLSIAGFYAGTLFHSIFLGSFDAALRAEFSFNYILIAIALGGIYIVPSIRSIILAVAGIGIAVLFTDMIGIFLSLFKIPAFTLPFNLVVIPSLYILRSIQFHEFAWTIKNTPEKTLFSYLLNQCRFSRSGSNIYLPFSGNWKVYQGFDDEWTHKGDWQYAYDFVIEDNEGKTFKNNGLTPSDYYAFKKPVLSPVRGYVIKAVSHFKDNAISEVDTQNNWGNHVIIQSNSGMFVELSHFAENSVKVMAGDYVEAGQLLGLCGNSGYSPQPHIHVQVQQSAELGSRTIPFSFINFKNNSQIYWFSHPEKNSIVESFVPDNDINTILSFTLDMQYTFELTEKNAPVSRHEFTVCMDHITGKFYFKDECNNRLFFSKDSGMFYFYDYQGKDSPLLMLYIAAPRIPLMQKPKISWSDHIPARYLSDSFIKYSESFMAIFRSSSIFKKGNFEMSEDRVIHGQYDSLDTTAHLDSVNGFTQLQVRGRILKRV